MQQAMPVRRPIVVTDLDGTLLDHRSYQWAPAEPALLALKRAGVPLILNPSKTRSEMLALRAELGNKHPFIIENGAAVIIPAGYFEPGPEQTRLLGKSRESILEVLGQLRQQGFDFRNFDVMSPTELARLTGLSAADAANAKQRVATEPLLWQGSDGGLEAFRSALARHRLQLVKGGRFYHAMGFFDKADAMQHLLDRYREHYRGDSILSIALGDSPNDLQMLQMADIAVVIKGVNSGELMLPPSNQQVIYSSQEGSAGWNACVLEILAQLGSPHGTLGDMSG